MARFSSDRAAARGIHQSRVANASAAVADAARMADRIREHSAVQQRTSRDAYGKATALAMQTAGVVANAETQAGAAKAKAIDSLGKLAMNLGNQFAATQQGIIDAEASAQLAEDKKTVVREQKAGLAAGRSGANMKEDAALAYRQTYMQGKAEKSADDFFMSDIRPSIAQAAPGSNISDLVYEKLGEANQEMEPEYKEWFNNRLLTQAREDMQRKVTNDRKAASMQAYADTKEAILGSMRSGLMVTREDLEVSVDKLQIMARGHGTIMTSQAVKSELFTALLNQAKADGRVQDFLYLLEQEDYDEYGAVLKPSLMSEIPPKVQVQLRADASAELTLKHKDNLAKATAQVEGVLGTLNVSRYDPEGDLKIDAVTAMMATHAASFGSDPAYQKLLGRLEQASQKQAAMAEDYREFQEAYSRKTLGNLDPKVLETYGSDVFNDAVLSSTQAQQSGDKNAVAESQKKIVGLLEGGYLPKPMKHMISSIAHADLTRLKPEERRQWLVERSQLLAPFINAVRANEDFRGVIAKAIGEDGQAAAKMQMILGRAIHQGLIPIEEHLSEVLGTGDLSANMEQSGKRSHFDAWLKNVYGSDNGEVGLVESVMSDITNGPGLLGVASDLVGSPGLFGGGAPIDTEYRGRVRGAIVNSFRETFLVANGSTAPADLADDLKANALAAVSGMLVTIPGTDGKPTQIIAPDRQVAKDMARDFDGVPTWEIAGEQLGHAKALLPDMGDEVLTLGANKVSVDGSFAVMLENGVTPLVLESEDAGDLDALNEKLAPRGVSAFEESSGLVHFRWKLDRSNLVHQKHDRAESELRAKEEQRALDIADPDGALRRKKKDLLTGAGRQSVVKGGAEDDRMTRGDVKAEGQRQHQRASFHRVIESLQAEGLISPDIGGRRALGAFTNHGEAFASLLGELGEHQVKRNGGLPVNPKSAPVEQTYQSRRMAHMKKVEGYRKHVYRDHKGIATIGVGINLESPSTQVLLTAMGVKPEAVISGETKLSETQLDTLFEQKVIQAEKIVSTKIKRPLSENQRLALVSLAFNAPSLIGPNLTKLVNEGSWAAAEKEIRTKSNLRKHQGLQTRRNGEADLFAIDTHTPSPAVVV